MSQLSKLFIVATPIGNLKDISARALTTLQEVDLILCEDTRVTKKLLDHYQIKKPSLSFHEHSDEKRVREIFNFFKEGKNLALVTDAGTPGISDPGGKLIEQIVQADIPVIIYPIPGSCAAIAALSICGFPTDEFIFLGFPPNKKGRKTFFERLAIMQSTIVFYESPYRILKTMQSLEEIIPSRPLVVCKELTKLHETIYRGCAKQVTTKIKIGSIRGEWVVVVGKKNLKN
ncbi:16S rRNA (cytidine(1402)-2'-O)-methyltransferase [Candidatus Uhrbacteria bacterium CG_4_9_14_3_um_filter_36_7]|uniref:Ribosomal RNA small subunit methyltransferase I n=1 Tax=Candidatus Uhrbacteria bacterium CG_4_9_14_3_um_filter_36_7 TaxID=1975033 RepID=A0A2M7XFU8_9BACT|nr:MAG: 16S rRNA (cytidine(1402)-2'-O)-methyltransferase [Candidatus Uhrbacteria bacterium CG_4_9_14_3_um_filter_36_7]